MSIQPSDNNNSISNSSSNNNSNIRTRNNYVVSRVKVQSSRCWSPGTTFAQSPVSFESLFHLFQAFTIQCIAWYVRAIAIGAFCVLPTSLRVAKWEVKALPNRAMVGRFHSIIMPWNFAISAYSAYTAQLWANLLPCMQCPARNPRFEMNTVAGAWI